MNKYSKEYFQKMGKKGGDKTRSLYGLHHYSSINPKKRKKILLDKQAEKEAFPQLEFK